MLYALMLRSANDGCYAVAVHIAGSVDSFARMMNERAKEIGCLHTNFHNPHGLNDELHTTTARDLALIAREAMKYEWFREVVKTRKRTISRSINWKDTHMISKNKWLAKDASADGIKTGYTRPAGLCYVGSATRNGFRVITSLMKSENWQKDHQQMLNWAFKYYEKKDQVKAGDVVGSAKVTGGAASEVELIAQSDAYALGRKGVNDVERIVSTFETPAPVKEGDVLGTLILRDKEGFEQKIPLMAKDSVAMSTSYAVTKSARSNGWAVALGSLMFIGAYVARGRSRRPRYGKSTKKTIR
jgi:D-alanyl-D-alanine carboxypeptidase (penicillin-binding protein 5/6)